MKGSVLNLSYYNRKLISNLNKYVNYRICILFKSMEVSVVKIKMCIYQIEHFQ